MPGLTFAALLAALLLAMLPARHAIAESGYASEPQVLLLPFPFYNENFGAAVGAVYGLSAFPEPQSRVIATAFGGTYGAGMVFLAGQDLRFPVLARLFIDPTLSFGYFKDTQSFINGNPRFPGQQAGSNQSSEDNYIEGSGLDYYARGRFKFLLPIGHGDEQIIPNYELDRGLLVGGATGATSLNPLDSGRTFASARPFYRNQQIDTDDIEENEFRTNGIDLALFWDNRDFPANPSQGQGVRFQWSRDFGLLDTNGSWTAMEGEIDQYFDFGATDGWRQRVLALDAWTAYSPTWREQQSGKIVHRPPSYTGANLGGLWRMRAFPSQRFSDAAALYYCAELRFIPDWNPFEAWPWFQRIVGVNWLQVVPFVEMGRVAPSYDVSNLHSSMKWDAGLGIRLSAKGFVIRADAAVSDEDFGIQMMISQPFQF